jgi:hypothetical protein
MAASALFFAAAGLELPAALNGPQYIADRGTSDPKFRAAGDVLHVSIGPGLGLALSEEVRSALTPVA